MSEHLEIRRDGRLVEIALNRPEKRNALNVPLCIALADALEQAAADPQTGAILLTANGKAFCAGMDLDEMLEFARATPRPEGDPAAEAHERLFTVGSRINKPLVAAVRGPALAGGMGLAANCHVVVAAEDALFGLTEIRLGLWPFLVFRAVAAAVGERRAVEMALTGRTFSGREAAQYGLAHYAQPAEEVEAKAREIAQGIAAASPEAIRAGMASVRRSRGKSAAEAGEIARRYREEVIQSEAFREELRRWRH